MNNQKFEEIKKIIEKQNIDDELKIELRMKIYRLMESEYSRGIFESKFENRKEFLIEMIDFLRVKQEQVLKKHDREFKKLREKEDEIIADNVKMLNGQVHILSELIKQLKDNRIIS